MSSSLASGDPVRALCVVRGSLLPCGGKGAERDEARSLSRGYCWSSVRDRVLGACGALIHLPRTKCLSQAEVCCPGPWLSPCATSPGQHDTGRQAAGGGRLAAPGQAPQRQPALQPPLPSQGRGHVMGEQPGTRQLLSSCPAYLLCPELVPDPAHWGQHQPPPTGRQHRASLRPPRRQPLGSFATGLRGLQPQDAAAEDRPGL